MGLHEALKLLGGVALLIFGIKTMGDSLQELAGDNMRRLLASLTGTPIKGAAAGALVTMLIQSSGATTVMVVSFVHAGLMSLAQGFSVVLGANVGTTITAQLIAFDIKKYSIIAAVIGAAFTVTGKSARHRQIGFGLVGFSLLFVGMGMMQEAMSFLNGRPELFMSINDSPIKGLFVGAAVTMLVQASAATVGITMALASQGLLTLPAAVAVILGDNIGTTVAAVLASLGGSRAAKQAAAAHVMFNVIGASIMMCLLTPFTKLVSLTADDISRQVANSHTLFNVLNAALFLPFIKPYTEMIKRLIPDAASPEPSMTGGTLYLDTQLIDVAPAAGVDAVRKEVVSMGKLAREMVSSCQRVITRGETELIEDIASSELKLNALYHAITDYAAALGASSLSPDLSALLSSFAGGSADIERMGDHCENMIELVQDLMKKKQPFSPKAQKELDEMFEIVLASVDKSLSAVKNEDYSLVLEVVENEKRIDEMEDYLRERHIERLNKGKCHPNVGVAYIDILNNLERIGDHAHNLSLTVKDVTFIHNKTALDTAPGLTGR